MSNGESCKIMHPQMVAQWITSLAVSIVCCAVLFIIFAGYIVQLHDETSLLSLKVSLLDERNVRQANEIEHLRRGPSVQINTAMPQNISVVPPANLVPPIAPAPAAPPMAITPPAQEKTDIVLPTTDEPEAPPDIIVPPVSPTNEPPAKAKH